MKLSVVQVVLGLLVVGSTVLFEGSVMPGYWVRHWFDGHDLVTVFVNPGSNTAMRAWYLAYLCLGLLVLVSAVGSFFVRGRPRLWLASAQVILGGLLVLALTLLVVWLEPQWVPHTWSGLSAAGAYDRDFANFRLEWKTASIMCALAFAATGILRLWSPTSEHASR